MSGSPPRVREKLYRKLENGTRTRITPASAGKTKSRILSLAGVWDHPRECGKNLEEMCCYAYELGSPPRVREKRWS